MKFGVGLLILPLTIATLSASGGGEQKRVRESAAVLQEILGAPDRGIPERLMDRAECVGVIPNQKRVGFIVSGRYGKGIVVCRTGNARGWSAPSTVRIEGGGVGFQIGAGETDVVFLVMNRDGMNKLMRDKFTVGADASAMAGPVGRSAEAKTDAAMRAEIVSYSRARGAFAGISLNGATLRPDNDDNRAVYGRNVTQAEILRGAVPPPPGTDRLYSELNRYAPAQRSSISHP